MTKKITMIVLLLLFIFPAWSLQEPTDIEKVEKIFNQLEKKNNLWANSLDANKIGWKDSYTLMAYVTKYEVTKNNKYLKKIKKRIGELLDNPKGWDEFRKKEMPTWTHEKIIKNNKSDKRRVARIALVGMVTYPIARWLYLIKRDKQSFLGYKFDAYLEQLEKMVGAFDEDWREHWQNQGFYTEKVLEAHANVPYGKPIPFNQQNALGRTIINLWLITGKIIYKNKAEKLANFFKSHLILKQDRYDWKYWPAEGNSEEDVSHATPSVDFAFLCYRSNIGTFNEDDMKKFANTFESFTTKKNGKITFFQKICSMNAGYAKSPNSVGRWLHISYFSKKPKEIYLQYLIEKKEEIGNKKEIDLQLILGAGYILELHKNKFTKEKPLSQVQ